MTVDELKKMIANNNNWDSYEKYGIRIQEQDFELGTVDHNSKVWVDGEETEDELDGICAINLNSPEAAGTLNGHGYFGSHIALLASNRFEYGLDAGEVILKDAEVLYIIK